MPRSLVPRGAHLEDGMPWRKDELIEELKALRQQAARCEAQQSHLAELEKSHAELQAGRPERAETILARALKAAPLEPRLVANLLNALESQGKHAEAEKALR